MTPERILREAIRRYRKAPPGKKQQRFHEMRRANLEALKACASPRISRPVNRNAH